MLAKKSRRAFPKVTPRRWSAWLPPGLAQGFGGGSWNVARLARIFGRLRDLPSGMGRRRRQRAAQMRARYAGGWPNDEARAIHRRYIAGPLPRLLPIAAVLDVPRRISGVIVHVPLAIVPYRSHWYLVSMLGDQANWVRNVQAGAGDAVLLASTAGYRRRGSARSRHR
jgi:hypothetical protein